MVDDFDAVAPQFKITKVHPEKHISPVAGLGATRPGMDREITVFGIVLPGKGALEFIRIDRFRDLIQFSVDFRGLRLGAFLLSDFDQGEKVMDTAIDTGMAVDFIFEAFGLTSDFLCFGGISPDIRLFEEGFEFGKALPFSGNVKDGLRVRSPVIRGLSPSAAVLQTRWSCSFQELYPSDSNHQSTRG